MVKFTVRNNFNAETVIANETSTVCEVFEQAGVEMGNGTVNINGRVISGVDYDKPINSLVGDYDEYIVASVAKADCA